ncbi:UDP-N-acetylmuramate dehydrogenase [Allopusillimonas soli]|uniref:UDP-N-acetylenolpyruvoylglucosamine reductase n=1 Tax=Allopusillimonas soli TaxID=659016 RepID=A0A853FID7_9BURK|nr:UDP-N-acetylmuramate dehydrogenase [Allopusillimonas soli]
MLQTVQQDLTACNTLGLPSLATTLLRLRSPDQLPALCALAQAHRCVFVLGGGSNVVLGPRLEGLVIKVETRGIRLLEETDTAWIVEAQAGEVWHDFVTHCLDQGWFGLENLALIPGTVGAAPVQNIGAYGVELDQRFHSLVAWDLRAGRAIEMAAPDCGFAYRDSVFKYAEPGRWLIAAVRFRLPRPWQPVVTYPDLRQHPAVRALLTSATDEGAGAGNDALASLRTAGFGAESMRKAAERPGANIGAPFSGVSPRAIYEAVCEIRRRKLPDPAILGNAGSFFKNPVVTAASRDALLARYPGLVSYAQPGGSHYKLAAGWLIEQAGWKGRRLGQVGTHDRQALVVVNHGGAQAEDIVRLAHAIKSDVRARFGVELEQEPVQVDSTSCMSKSPKSLRAR